MSRVAHHPLAARAAEAAASPAGDRPTGGGPTARALTTPRLRRPLLDQLLCEARDRRLRAREREDAALADDDWDA